MNSNRTRLIVVASLFGALLLGLSVWFFAKVYQAERVADYNRVRGYLSSTVYWLNYRLTEDPDDIRMWNEIESGLRDVRFMKDELAETEHPDLLVELYCVRLVRLHRTSQKLSHSTVRYVRETEDLLKELRTDFPHWMERDEAEVKKILEPYTRWNELQKRVDDVLVEFEEVIRQDAARRIGQGHAR